MDREAPDDRIGIQSLYNEFRVWSIENVAKGRKRPDRNQIKAYFEKLYGQYPSDGKGWKGLRFKIDSQFMDD